MGAALAAVYLLAPTDSPVQVLVWFVPLVAAVVLHTRRFLATTGTARRPLGYLLLGLLGYVVMSLVWYLTPVVFGGTLPFPSPLDLGYYAVYAAYAVFLVMVIRRQRPADPVDSRLAVVDALILTSAMSTVAWKLVIDPNLSASADTLATAAAVAYPAFTVLLFGLAARVAVTGTRPDSARLLLLGWIGTEVLADTIYGYQGANGTFAYGTWLSALWLASYVFMAAFAVSVGTDRLLSTPNDVPDAPGGPTAAAPGVAWPCSTPPR